MSTRCRGPIGWLSDIYTPRPMPHPAGKAPDVARGVVGLLACLMLLFAVLALTGVVLQH